MASTNSPSKLADWFTQAMGQDISAGWNGATDEIANRTKALERILSDVFNFPFLDKDLHHENLILLLYYVAITFSIITYD